MRHRKIAVRWIVSSVLLLVSLEAVSLGCLPDRVVGSRNWCSNVRFLPSKSRSLYFFNIQRKFQKFWTDSVRVTSLSILIYSSQSRCHPQRRCSTSLLKSFKIIIIITFNVAVRVWLGVQNIWVWLWIFSKFYLKLHASNDILFFWKYHESFIACSASWKCCFPIILRLVPYRRRNVQAHETL